eukprot:gene3608-5103_t
MTNHYRLCESAGSRMTNHYGLCESAGSHGPNATGGTVIDVYEMFDDPHFGPVPFLGKTDTP